MFVQCPHDIPLFDNILCRCLEVQAHVHHRLFAIGTNNFAGHVLQPLFRGEGCFVDSFPLPVFECLAAIKTREMVTVVVPCISTHHQVPFVSWVLGSLMPHNDDQVHRAGSCYRADRAPKSIPRRRIVLLFHDVVLSIVIKFDVDAKVLSAFLYRARNRGRGFRRTQRITEEVYGCPICNQVLNFVATRFKWESSVMCRLDALP